MAPDIEVKIRKDFGNCFEEALAVIERHSSTLSDRVLRCVIVLSKGSLENLRHYIALAETDWRDVIYQAETTPFQCNYPFRNNEH